MDGGMERYVVVEHPLPDKVTSLDQDDTEQYDPHYYGVTVDDKFIYYTDWKNG